MQNPYDDFFFRTSYDDLFLQRRMKRARSIQHARDSKDFSTPA